MTWQQIISTTEGGNGTLEYRIHIEGFDYDFCTSQDMCNLSVYPYRVNGLLRKGLQISEMIELPNPVLKISSNNLTIVDYQEKATEAFYRKPTFTCYLIGSVSPTDTVWTISNSTGLSIGDYLWIGTECIKVLGMVVGSTIQIIVQRGALDSTPQAYYTKTDLGIAVKPFIQNVPFTIERKRAFLYAYGEGDDLQGEGTLIYRGLILKQPIYKGTNFTLELGPITELLKSEIGIDSDDVKLRGIFFGPYKWVVGVDFLSQSGAIGTTILTSFTGSVYGFFDDKFSLAQNINTSLAYGLTSSGYAVSASVGCCVSPDTNELLFTQKTLISSSFFRFYTLAAPTSRVFTDIYPYFNINQVAYNEIDSYGVIDPQNVNPLTSQWQTDTQYVSRTETQYFPNQYTIYTKDQPKGGTQYNGISVATGSLDNYSKRLYLSTPINALMNDIIIYDSDGAKIATNALDKNRIPINVNFFAENNYIEPTLFFDKTTDNFYLFHAQGFFVVDNNYKIALATTFNQTNITGSTVTTVSTNVVDFLDLLIDKTPFNTSNGFCPLITSNDIDIADMRAQINKLSLKAFQANRKYVFFKKSKKLDEFLAEEFKLLGVIPALTSDGKLTIKTLRNINPYEEPDYTLDADDILTDNSYPTIETNKFGIWNAVAIKTKYNPITQKHEGDTIIQNNIDSISIYNRSKQIEIAPMSFEQYSPNNLTPDMVEDFKDILYRSTSLFAKDYWVVTLEVPLKYFSVPIGSTIRLKTKQLPNYTPNFSFLTSRRGSGRILGRLIEKKFDLEKGFGAITILVSDIEYQGTEANIKAVYAPDVLLSSATNLGGGFWTLVFDTAYSDLTMPANETQSNYWNVGDGIKLIRFNSDTQDAGYGTILEVLGTGNDLTLIVNLNSPGSAPSGLGTYQYILKTTDFNSVQLQTSQQKYAFIDTGTIDANNINYPGTLNRIFTF